MKEYKSACLTEFRIKRDLLIEELKALDKCIPVGLLERAVTGDSSPLMTRYYLGCDSWPQCCCRNPFYRKLHITAKELCDLCDTIKDAEAYFYKKAFSEPAPKMVEQELL